MTWHVVISPKMEVISSITRNVPPFASITCIECVGYTTCSTTFEVQAEYNYGNNPQKNFERLHPMTPVVCLRITMSQNWHWLDWWSRQNEIMAKWMGMCCSIGTICVGHTSLACHTLRWTSNSSLCRPQWPRDVLVEHTHTRILSLSPHIAPYDCKSCLRRRRRRLFPPSALLFLIITLTFVLWISLREYI